MAEPWFRCHADLASKRVTWRLSRELNVSLPLAAGHLAFLWGKLSIEYAAGRFDGQIASVTTEQIEKYAHWRGEKGAFANWVRTRHTDQTTGTLREWDTYMGALVKQRQSNASRVADWREKNRERDNENQRRRRAEQKQQQTKSAVDVTHNVEKNTAAVADVTNYVAPLSTTTLNKLLSEIVNDTAFKDKSLSASTNGSSSSGVTSEMLRSLLERWLNVFYGEASFERAEVVLWQIHATRHSERGAFVARNEPHATSTQRSLYNALSDMLAERSDVKDYDKAIVVLLKKLQSGKANLDVVDSATGETYTESVSRGTRALDAQPIEDARAAEIVNALAQSKTMPDPKRQNAKSAPIGNILGSVADSMREMLHDLERAAPIRSSDARTETRSETSDRDDDVSSLD